MLPKIPSFIDEIIVADGGSNDNSILVAKKHGCKVITKAKGKGSAIIRGSDAASGEVVVIFDADLSHNPDEIKALLDGLGETNDLCYGSRFLPGGGSSDLTLLRKFGNKFFIWIVNLLCRSNISDLCYGLKAFKKTSLRSLNLSCQNFGIETEITMKALKKGLVLCGVPSYELKRKHGKGKFNSLRDGLNILITMVSLVILNDG